MTVKDLVSTLSIDYDIRLEEDGVFLCDTTSSTKILGVFSNREVIEWCPKNFPSISTEYIVINIKKEYVK